MKYKRLTKRHENGIAGYNCTAKDRKDCGLYYDCGECPVSLQVLRRLAELEDKIENGTLVELPRMLTYVDYCYGIEKYVVEWIDNGRVKSRTYWSEKKAEKKLKELGE